DFLEIHDPPRCSSLLSTVVLLPLILCTYLHITSNMSSFDRANEAVSFLTNSLPEGLRKPQVAIVCGSGLGGLAETVQSEPRAEFDYTSIPHFPRPTVAGHAGKLVFGLLGQKIPAVLMVGRAHYYEGHSMEQVTFPIRVFKQLGVDTVVLTNAAGGLNSDYSVGDITLLNDHLFLAGLAGNHPLRGLNDEEFGVRFPPLSDAYDLDLRRHVHRAWKEITSATPQTSRKLHEGVYAFVGGPHLRNKSRKPHASNDGCRRAPVPRGDEQLLQDKAAGELNALLEEGKAGHEEVLEAGRAAAMDMQKLVVQTLVNVFGSA
ncbi:hypothetical protein N7481_012761, partial [Penicillium waksmanii]|uniref:uncharacterized protein n=1 Tax=Penicillium waksmanii TaxID=69791 RepID=UPI002548F397